MTYPELSLKCTSDDEFVIERRYDLNYKTPTHDFYFTVSNGIDVMNVRFDGLKQRFTERYPPIVDADRVIWADVIAKYKQCWAPEALFTPYLSTPFDKDEPTHLYAVMSHETEKDYESSMLINADSLIMRFDPWRGLDRIYAWCQTKQSKEAFHDFGADYEVFYFDTVPYFNATKAMPHSALVGALPGTSFNDEWTEVLLNDYEQYS
jgi:hypothetical protein